MNYKELFIDKDDVLLIRKELVRVLGDLNEAVILNQLNYWIEINKKAEKNLHDGKYWVFNTYQTWKETDFDFWSTDTIRRTLTRLENKGIVLTANYNKLKIDKTKWYTIDYERLQKLIDEHEEKQVANKENADCGHDMANCTDGNGSISKAIPKNTTETTNIDYDTETTDNSLYNDKDNSKTKVLELHNSPVSEETKQETHVLKTLGRKTHAPKQEPLKDMPTRAREIADRLVDDTETADKVSDCISYFLEQYKSHRHKEHIHLTNDKLHDVVITMLSTITIQHENDGGMFESDYNPLVADNVDIDDIHWVIDQYFQTQFREKTDYSLVHFTQEGVLTNVMNKCMLGGNPWHESHSL